MSVWQSHFFSHFVNVVFIVKYRNQLLYLCGISVQPYVLLEACSFPCCLIESAPPFFLSARLMNTDIVPLSTFLMLISVLSH